MFYIIFLKALKEYILYIILMVLKRRRKDKDSMENDWYIW